MNINQIRYVMAVKKTKSFTLAAEQCYVTQPTLSNGISQLEDEFEEKIFTRTTRSVSLTPFGECILPYIEKVLTAQTELLQASRNYKKPIQKIIRIGISPIISSQWLVPMIDSFRKNYSDTEIILHEQNMADLYRMLDENLLDCVFGIEDIKKTTWQIIPLYQEALYFIPRSNPISGTQQTVYFGDIVNETFVMVPNVCGLATITRTLFRKYRKKLKEYSGEALSYQVLEEWAALGLGAAILPQSKLQEAKRRACRLIDKKGHSILITMIAYFPNQLNTDAYLNDLLKFLNAYNTK